MSSNLLNMYIAGRNMRMQELELQREEQARRKDAEIETKRAAAWGKFLQPQTQSPMASLVATPEQEAESAAMGARFPETRGMMANDGPQAVNPLRDPQRRQELMQSLAAISPDEFFKATEMFDKLDAAQLKKVGDIYKLGGATLLELRRAPTEQREALRRTRAEQWGAVVPELGQYLMSLQLDDATLENKFNSARDIEKVVEAYTPKTMFPVPGSVETTVMPNLPFGPPANTGGGDTSGVAAAVEELRRDPSPEAMREFDEIFGAGAAQEALAMRQNQSAGNTMTRAQYNEVVRAQGKAFADNLVRNNNIRIVN